MRRQFDTTPQEDPHAQLERAFIEEYLRGRNHTLTSVGTLPDEQASTLLKEASLYASGRLCEVESRAHLIGELHHGHESQERQPHALAGTDAAAALPQTPPPQTVRREKPAPVRRRPLKWL